MGNTIEHIIKPIQYGPHEIKNERTEARIRFLEDPNNDDKPLSKDLFLPGHIELINQMGRRKYAQRLREQLLGLPGG